MQQEMQGQEEMTNHAFQPAHVQDLLSDTGIETRLAAGSWGTDWQQDEVGVCVLPSLSDESEAHKHPGICFTVV